LPTTAIALAICGWQLYRGHHDQPEESIMKPRTLIGTALVDAGEELRLFQHGDDFVIALNRNELMNSRMSGSEEALAEMTCERLRESAPHILIGGYGMGFTLRAALAVLSPEAQVTVVELVPEIIAWARGPMEAMTAGCLDDPRVDLLSRDVAGVIRDGRGLYDAILLDVDNGPDGLTRRANNRLYSMAGLALARAALRPGAQQWQGAKACDLVCRALGVNKNGPGKSGAALVP
jgi:spermidine synthase